MRSGALWPLDELAGRRTQLIYWLDKLMELAKFMQSNWRSASAADALATDASRCNARPAKVGALRDKVAPKVWRVSIAKVVVGVWTIKI